MRKPASLAALSGLVTLGLLAGLTVGSTWSAFSGVTGPAGNDLRTGTVYLSDNDASVAMFSLAGMRSTDAPVSRCLVVTYLGSLPSTVSLYGSSTGVLPAYLTLTVARGTDAAPAFSSCASFTADATNYTGAGPGVVYTGTLAGFPASYAAGIVDPTAATPATWVNGTTHSYRFTVSLTGDPAAAGQSGTAGFSFEARNQ